VSESRPGIVLTRVTTPLSWVRSTVRVSVLFELKDESEETVDHGTYMHYMTVR
jgi:hypothetical protein